MFMQMVVGMNELESGKWVLLGCRNMMTPFKEGDCDLWAEVLAIYRSNLQKKNNREKTGMQVRVGYAKRE